MKPPTKADKIVWKKDRQGRFFFSHKGHEYRIAPKADHEHWFVLRIDGVRRAEGGKQFCKDQAARYVSGSKGLLSRKPGEKISEWFCRMASEYGYCPRFLAGMEYVLLDADIDPEKLTPEFLKKMSDLTWPLAVARVNETLHKSSLSKRIRFVLGLKKSVCVHHEAGGFYVNKERDYWYGSFDREKLKAEEKRRMLAGLEAEKN